MQDNHFNIDKKFTDRAWEDMKSLLDQEMPNEKGKKRLLWAWLIACFGLLLLAGSTFYFQKQQHPTEIDNHKKPMTAQQPIAGAILEKETPTTQANNEESPSTTDESDPAKQKLPLLNGGKSVEGASIGTKTQRTGHLAPALPNDRSEGMVSDEENMLAESQAMAYIGEEKNQAETFASAAVRQENRHLPILPIPHFFENKQIEPVLHFDEKTKSHRNTLFASTLFSFQSKTNGLAAGYLRNLSAEGRRCSVEMGVGYEYIAQPIGYIFEEKAIGVSNPETFDILLDIGYANDTRSLLVTANSFQENHSPSSSDVSFNRLKLHYLTVPVFVNWRSGRFYATAGVKGGLLLFASNSSFEGGLFKSLGSADNRRLFDAQALSGDDRESIPATSKFDLAATVGIGFDLSSDAGLHIGYSHGMKDVIKHNSKNDFNRLAQLALKYNL